ncbi:hypothetical protein MNBD_GAMMA09-1999 [hydrothermal vent metagenome]|uniref:Uncharacterized protein n=1 Tax=hydrothermal vent metagenome TaxID=652676 RepID=A0A3B0Y5A9_9ZZZZ
MFKRLFASKQRPYFKTPFRQDTLSSDLSGTRFEISLPPQDYAFAEDPCLPKVNLFDKSLYDYETKPDRNGHPPHNQGVMIESVFKRKWFTYGPIWRARHIGSLQCAGVVCDTSQMVAGLNCFNPEHLENLILHDLYYSEGPGFGNENTSPVHWKIRQIQGVDWVYMESWSRKPAWIKSTDNYRDANFVAYMFTPLFEDKYLILSFVGIGSLPAEASNQALLARIESIVPSLKIELSPLALKQKADAEKKFPDAHYSQKREPEPWEYYTSFRDGDVLKGEKPLVIEGPCSPPPSLL